MLGFAVRRSVLLRDTDVSIQMQGKQGKVGGRDPFPLQNKPRVCPGRVGVGV